MHGIIKIVDKSLNDNSARRLDQSDIIVSGSEVQRALQRSCNWVFKSFTAAHFGSNTNQHVDWTVGGTFVISSKSVYAPHLVKSVILHLFNHRGGYSAHWISKNKMAVAAVQWKLCVTNFRQNIANLRVSCYNGDNGRSARGLFVQHPWEQGEWIRYARVLTAWFALLPRGLEEQHPWSRPLSPN